MDEKRTIDWGSLILGILFVLVSLLSFQDPVGNLVAIVVVFAIFAFIKGIFELFVRNRLKELTGYKGKMPLIIGIIDILVGVFSYSILVQESQHCLLFLQYGLLLIQF